MDTNYLENNYLTLVGKVTGEKKFSHEIYGERFYVFNLEIERLSGNADIIPITVSERLVTDEMLTQGKKLLVKGQFRSYNSYENEKNRLILTVFAKDVVEVEEPEEQEENEMVKKDMVTNEVILVGYICKKPIYRQTPFGREIADILLAVNRAYNKSDYIPTIAWGRTARFCQNLEVGTKVKIVGRVQSRMYEKKHEDGTTESRVAYEVSVGSLEVIEENLKQVFRPEFLNRLDEIVFYKPLQKTEIGRILDLLIKDLERRLDDKNISLNVTQSAKDYLINNGYDEVYGARPLKRFVQKKLETLIAKNILANKILPNTTITVDCKDDELFIK